MSCVSKHKQDAHRSAHRSEAINTNERRLDCERSREKVQQVGELHTQDKKVQVIGQFLKKNGWHGANWRGARLVGFFFESDCSGINTEGM